MSDRTVSPLDDVVSDQYVRWPYPQPIRDIPVWLKDSWQWFDPSRAHRMFWPDRPYLPEIDILIAGCGTNQGAVFAYTNPEAKVVAIDVSQPSLEHHQFLKDKYSLRNLELHLLPVEEVSSLNLDFDLIVSTGVLHCLAQPIIGMRALAKCLKRDGVMALMLYAKYGRIGVEILQSVFRDLGFSQNDASLLMVRDILKVLPQNHPIKGYMSIAGDLHFDAGLVDTFLHGREKTYSVDDCINLVKSAGLAFQDLFLKSPYYPPHDVQSPFYAFVASLPEERQWSIMERINFSNACHFFTACRKDRMVESYKVDFQTDAILDSVPSFRHRCELIGTTFSRNKCNILLNPVETALIRQVDGTRTLREIFKEASMSDGLSGKTLSEVAVEGRTIFQKFWRLDFLSMGLKPMF